MPRTYEKTPGKRSHASYSPESVVAAVNAVNKRNFTVYAASKVFGVPYGTLFNKTCERPTSMLVESFLDDNKLASRFPDNMPEEDWTFLKPLESLSEPMDGDHLAESCQIEPGSLYFDNLTDSVTGVFLPKTW
ncbi:hypothetical protein quinque_008069 [Culex quinquefasciatus]